VTFDFQAKYLQAIAPEVLVLAAALVALMWGVFARSADTKRPDGKLPALALAGIILALVNSAAYWGKEIHAFSGTVVLDNLALFLNFMILAGAGLSVLLSVRYAHDQGIAGGEYYTLLLLATAGMMFMAAGTDLLTIFISLEIMSISIYVLAGLRRRNERSLESAFKYFILGAFSTGFLLYGMALVFGATGTTNLARIAAYLAAQDLGGNFMLLAGMGLLLVGFGFKVASVPFHLWTPDVYEGAPTSITAFMSVGVKAAAFAAFLRLFAGGLVELKVVWVDYVGWLAVLTMVVGNVAALYQRNIKRLLAYSSIAHAGYLLVGLVAATGTPGDMGAASMAFYLFVYTFMNVGAFAVVLLLERENDGYLGIRDYAGLGRVQPKLAVLLTVFLFSLAGFPPLAGFVAKFYLFNAAVQAGQVWLAVIGVLASLVSVYYYLRVVVYMFMTPAEEGAAEPTVSLSAPAVVALAIAVFFTIYLGVIPGGFMKLAVASVAGLL